MIKNSFMQKVLLTMFWGLCAAGLIEFYKNIIWRANEDINGEAAQRELYGDARQVAHPIRRGSNAR
jgi:hypothetical protein